VEKLFPVKYSDVAFQVRHGGDPLLAALNLAKTPGRLTFGQSRGEKLVISIFSISLSTVVSCGILRYLKKIGNCIDVRGDVDKDFGIEGVLEEEEDQKI